MKDILGREIHAGYTLAYAGADVHSGSYPYPTLKLANVTGVSDFAIQLTPTKTCDYEPSSFVVSDASQYAIVRLA